MFDLSIMEPVPGGAGYKKTKYLVACIPDKECQDKRGVPELSGIQQTRLLD
jgi:hypothetical protein